MANGQVNPKLHKDLLLACGWGKEIDVVLLLQQGASVKVQDQNGRNCLHYAASKGHTNIVEILLLKKCNANAKDKYGSTPLHQSAVNGHTECASILIEGGSEVNFQDDNGNTPLYEAVWNNQPDTVDLLLNNEADVNIRNKEAYTPLHLACQNNNGKIIQNLVKWGANLQSPTSTGNTPLHIAIQNSKVDAVKTLLGLDADINLQNHDGDTPLHLCAELGDKKITTLILECGQPYEASLNNVGDSPKDIAVQLGNKDVADMIPTPMVGRKQQKKNSDVPGSPKRTQKQRTANKSKHVTPTDDKMKTDSLERPVRVVVQPASVDNLLATDTCSSLSSLWLPVPDANESLPVDVHWQKSLSPCPERKARNFDNITDLAALKEIKRSDQHSQSDASSIKSPRYQIRKKRRKYVTGHVSSKQKVQDDDWEEVIDEKEKETKRVKDPKASKLFKKKKKNSSRKLKKVDEQREEEENSIPSPISQNKSDITSGLASPRVRGRAELKAEFADKSIGNGEQNGDVPMEQKFNEDQKQYTKGLREYLKTSLVSRRSPANTDEGSSSKTGTLEHKRGKEGRIVQAAELKEHMRLTERDIDALLKKDFLENTTVNGVPQLKSVDRKSSRKTKKKVREPDNDGDDIVVIRLDPKLELPKKAKRTKERKALDNGGKEGYDSIRREKKEAKSSKGGHVDGSFEGGTLRREGGEKRGDKTKMDGSKTLERKEKKVEHKEWPKFEVVLDESCGVEPGPSGKTTPHDRSHNQGAEKSQRHHNHHNHHEQRRKTPDRPSNEATIEMIHKLEKRFRNFLQLTTEKLDEQRECDNKHYSDLKNDISSMERNLERTARNSAVEMIENVTKELDTTMRKWAKVLRGMKFEERKEVSSSAASSTFDIVCEEEGKVVTKAIVQRSHHDAETAPSDVVISSTPIRGSKTGKENGFVVCEDAADKVTRILDEEPVQTLVNGRTDVGNGLDHDDSFDVRREGRAAPQGRSDESSPCLQNRFPGDGDHMSLEKWYQTQLNETEERWRIKAEADQKALRNRIKELEDALFEFTGTHNTMV